MSTTSGQKYDSSLEQILHKRSDLHILRKIWHISAGSSVLYFWLRTTEPAMHWAIGVLLLSIFAFALDFTRKRVPALNKIVLLCAGPLMRRSEREGWSGIPFYALGCSLSLFFYHKDIATLSVMFLVFADPVSSFFGVLYGKDKLLPNKSLQGAVAGFFTCYLITLFYVMNSAVIGPQILIFSIFAGFIGAGSELISAFNIDDNLTIPVISGLGMTLLNHFIPLYN